MKDPKKVKQGKRNRSKGLRFEKKVRADLEKSGWIVSKWQNNVKFEWTEIVNSLKEDYENKEKIKTGKLVPAKMGRFQSNQGGFPDFVCFRCCGNGKFYTESEMSKHVFLTNYVYELIGVECKVGKYLSKEEKEKIYWLLENKIFSKVLIAYPKKNKEDGRKTDVKYDDFEEKYGKKTD